MGGPITVPFFTTHTLLAAASLSRPSRNITVSSAPCSKLIWRANTAPSRLMDLMCAFCQRKSSAVTQATPCARCSAVAVFIGRQVAKTVGVRPSSIGWSRRATPRVT